MTNQPTKRDKIASIAAAAGIYREAGDLETARAYQQKARDLMAGIESTAVRDDYRRTYAYHFDRGRRTYHHIGNCEAFPVASKPLAPTANRMRRTLQDIADLERFHQRDAESAVA